MAEGSAEAGHTHVIGRTRSGKTKALEGWMLRAIANGYGVCAIDPHGDLFNDLVTDLALICSRYPRLAERIVIFDPLDPEWSVGFNPLQVWPGELPERKALFLADVICKVFEDDPTIVVRMRRVMRYTFLALMELDLTLVDLPRFLMDRAHRERLLSKVSDPRVLDFWLSGFPSSAREADVWVASSLNRLEPLVSDPDFRLIFGQKESTISFRKLMDEGMVLLVNTSKGLLMDDNSRLLGAFLVAQLQQAAMTRVDLPKEQRRPFVLVLDEFQTYVSPAISTLLEETGKYKLSLILAHQHLAQLKNDELRESVLSQCADTVCFGIGDEDARILAPKIFKTDVNAIKHTQVKPANWGHDIVEPYLDITWRPLAESKEINRQRLVELGQRHFWYKSLQQNPILFKSHTLPKIDVPEAMKKSLIDFSGRRFAIPKPFAKQVIDGSFYKDGATEEKQLTGYNPPFGW